ncbi:MAG TPA: hypothetical protein VFJ13_06770 [Paracoccaceae bacterium]|nr:hypothetical protein [Paracoccaceae bacterium]
MPDIAPDSSPVTGARPAAIGQALHEMLLDIDRTVDWKLDLMRETAAADGRIRRLATAVEAALWLAPEGERADGARRLQASLTREAMGTGAQARFPDRVRLLHDFFANQRQSKVTSREVLRYLLAHGLEIDARGVARLMSAKCDQGILTRLARGSYRIERDHKTIARLVRREG